MCTSYKYFVLCERVGVCPKTVRPGDFRCVQFVFSLLKYARGEHTQTNTHKSPVAKNTELNGFEVPLMVPLIHATKTVLSTTCALGLVGSHFSLSHFGSSYFGSSHSGLGQENILPFQCWDIQAEVAYGKGLTGDLGLRAMVRAKDVGATTPSRITQSASREAQVGAKQRGS